MPDDQRLFDLLKLHTEEVRFQVNLTWDRAKSSLAFHAAWIAIVANFSSKKDVSAWLVFLMFLFASVSAFMGGMMVSVGHANYKKARDRRKEVEQALDTKFGIVTTPGDRGVGRWRVKIHVIITLMHDLLAFLALLGAWMYRPH